MSIFESNPCTWASAQTPHPALHVSVPRSCHPIFNRVVLSEPHVDAQGVGSSDQKEMSLMEEKQLSNLKPWPWARLRNLIQERYRMQVSGTAENQAAPRLFQEGTTETLFASRKRVRGSGFKIYDLKSVFLFWMVDRT